MKKRLLSLLLCLCMALTLLPGTAALAADTVGKVVLTVTAPKEGGTPATTATLPDTASTYVKGVQWKGELDANGKFQTGQSYTVYVLVGIKEGQNKTFDIKYASNITINGKEAKFQLQNSTELIVWYTFTLAAEVQTTAISTVAITITMPVAGNTADRSPVILANGASGLVNAVKVDWGGSFDGHVFKAGTSYTLSVRMEPAKSGYTFAKGVTATVNGLAAEILYRADSTMTVKYQYKPTAEEVNAAKEEEKYSIDKYYTMAETEAMRTNGRDGTLVGNSIADLDKLSEVEQQRLRKFVITGHNVEGATQLVSLLGSYFDLFRVNEVWFGPEYAGDEISDIMFFDNHFWSDMHCSGHMYSYDSCVYVSEASLASCTTYPGDMGDDYIRVRVYKGDDVETAAQRGTEDTRNWCTNHEYIGANCRDGTVYTYNDCTHTAHFYRVCGNCGACEYNPKQVKDWSVAGTSATSFIPVHAYADRVVENAYVGTDVNGSRVYYQSCSICGYTKKQDNLDSIPRQYAVSDKSATYAQYEKMFLDSFAATEKRALAGNNVVGMFRVEKAVTAKTSAWAQSDVNSALQNGLVDEELLGSDYTKACTRLQFCSVAVKLAETMTRKTITPAPASTFADTQNEYVLKAYAAGITSGTSATAFSPDGTLTRAQMAAFIYRALQYVKANSTICYTPYDSKLASYADNGQIQSWATEPMAFMNALGLIAGTSATTLSPENSCTIEQALIVANRSLTAHRIGWYIVRSDKELRGQWFGYCTFYTTADAATKYNYVPGEMIWMTGWRDSGSVGGDLITTEPYTGLAVKVVGDNFIPVREK